MALLPVDRILGSLVVVVVGGAAGGGGGEGERTREGSWTSRDPGPQLTGLMG